MVVSVRTQNKTELIGFWSRLLWNPKLGDRVFVMHRNRYGVIVGQVAENVYMVLFDGNKELKCWACHRDMRRVKR